MHTDFISSFNTVKPKEVDSKINFLPLNAGSFFRLTLGGIATSISYHYKSLAVSAAHYSEDMDTTTFLL
jgi:hypothetical protein